MKGTKTNQVEAFIDWENIRKRLSDNYIEKVTVDQVMEAISKVASEIGTLRKATFYGDFTLRRDEARGIQRKPHFVIRNVLRARSGRDQTDSALVADLLELIFTSHDFDSIVLCSGDSSYCELVRKVSIKGPKIYICAVGIDAAPDLTSLAPLFPIEKYLDMQLTRKLEERQVLTGLSPRDLSRWSKFVGILDSVESKLPFVALSYFCRDIMLSYLIGGQTQDDRYAYIESARESEIINVEQVDNPARPGKQMSVIRLNRDNAVVKEILARK